MIASVLTARKILRYLLSIDFFTFSVCEHSEYPSQTVNSHAKLCFNRMECLDFFGSGN